MEEKLMALKNEALSMIIGASNPRELEQIRVQFLGGKGKFTLLLKELPKLPIGERPTIGALANEVKKSIEEALQQAQDKLGKEKSSYGKKIDTTAPGIPPKIGHLHPVTQVLYEVVEIFKTIGFQVADGPEIETDYYNFVALNFPKDHPARDTQQTLFLDTSGSKIAPGEMLLRTHTSNMQIRVMEKLKPPIRVIIPGKVFRHEQVDVSHSFEFWQFEGFAFDRNITLADLFGTLTYFAKKFLGQEVKIKFACHYFPFTEPSTEAYISCVVCQGKGCSFCKQSGWVEILGAGMTHPNVLKAVGIDPAKWQGFAFGTGLSRLVTLKYQMDDLRLLTNPDLRILQQF